LAKRYRHPQKINIWNKAFGFFSAFLGTVLVEFLSLVIDKSKLWRYELTYKLHLKTRKYHDVLVLKSPSYKKITESKYAIPVRNATISAFFVSLLIFTSLQYVVPLFNMFKPGEAYAGSNSRTWTSQADFTTNAATTGSPTLITGTSAVTDMVKLEKKEISTISAGSSTGYRGAAVLTTGEVIAWNSTAPAYVANG